MITAAQLTKVLNAQSTSMDAIARFKELGFEYVEIGIDAEFAYFKVVCRNVVSEDAVSAIDYLKNKTRFKIVAERWYGNHFMMSCKIAA